MKIRVRMTDVHPSYWIYRRCRYAYQPYSNRTSPIANSKVLATTCSRYSATAHLTQSGGGARRGETRLNRAEALASTRFLVDATDKTPNRITHTLTLMWNSLLDAVTTHMEPVTITLRCSYVSMPPWYSSLIDRKRNRFNLTKKVPRHFFGLSVNGLITAAAVGSIVDYDYSSLVLR